MSAFQPAIPYLDVPDAELTERQLREKYAPVHLGPTWDTNPDGSWRLPEKTLGWEIAGWCAEYLHDPNSGGERPWKFTLEQLRFILWWYAVDENGAFVYRTGVMQRMKGHGKDPLAAVMCLVEWVGPSRFSHWDENGDPVAKPHPAALVQIAAVNQDQTRNTTTLFPALMSERFLSEYDVIPGAELFYAKRRTVRLQAVTSSFRALEGGRATFIILNETHHWIAGNNGHRMYETIDGNATKMAGRYLAITNAYLPGEDSVAEKMRNAYEKSMEAGREVTAESIGFLYDSLEAPAHAPFDPLVMPIILDMVRGDSKWLPIDDIIKSILNSTIPVSRSRRMWYNQIVSEEEALYSPSDWNVLEAPAGTTLLPGEQIVMGFDGGKTDDATALVAIRVHDRTAFVLGMWEKPDGPAGEGWEVDRAEVESAIHAAFRTYKVLGFYADVALWESNIHEWTRLYGEGLAVKAEGNKPIAWDMRRSLERVTRAHEALLTAIFERYIRHDGDQRLRRHVLNARRAENNYGVSFRKESRESSRKVDLYAALMLAFTCLRDYETRGTKVKERTNRGWFM